MILIISTIGCDQISKELVREKVKPNELIEVYRDNILLTKVENTGAALGLGQNLPPIGKKILLNFLPLVVLIALLFYSLRKSQVNGCIGIACAFIIGGGIGNLIDRFLFGSVTDFFYIQYGFLKTGIFNMADVSVTLGAIMLLLLSFLKPNKNPI
ncbi:MAG: signal peptidase II [Bacteroidota bacterium]